MAREQEPNAAFTIRAATIDDADRIASLLFDDMSDQGEAVKRQDLTRMVIETLDRRKSGALALVAVQNDDRPFGVLIASEKPSVRFGGWAMWVEELYVSPDARLGGVGRRLVVEALKVCRERGLVGVDLEAYRMNTAASILYRTIGFDRLPRERYAIRLSEIVWQDSEK